MLEFFYGQVKKVGKDKISVGAAPIEWVEKFYLKNGFTPRCFLVKVKKEELPKNYREKGFEILEERRENDNIVLIIRTGEYNQNSKEKIKKIFNASEVLYIMEKDVV